ncbi:MAG: copper-binding protein [Rubrivivax sp.]|nr:copper-binding protein [Rubrivivax sp.]MDH5339063.1 copper-binding protein [Rubrivivax sp.]
MKTIHSLLVAATMAVIGTASPAAFAQAATGTASVGDAKASDMGADGMSDAVVRKVDKEQGKVTLKHGPIKNLDMPPMTMVFTARDKALLDAVKPGDKVKFKAVDDHGKLTVTDMMPAQ